MNTMGRTSPVGWASGLGGGFYNFHTQGSEKSTIATWLDEAGYTTFLAGKYMNGYTGYTAARAL